MDASASSPTVSSPKSPKSKKAAKKPSAAAKAKKPANHPSYREMIVKSIGALKDRKGSSRQALLKHIANTYKVGDNLNKVNASIKIGLRAMIADGTIQQAKGHAGSFKIAQKPTKATGAKPRMKKPKTLKKKASPKKPKKAAAATVAAAEAAPAAAAASPKAAKKPKSPKKKKAATTKKPKKATTKTTKKAKKPKSPKKAKAAAKKA